MPGHYEGNPYLSFLEDEPRTAFFARQPDVTREGSALDQREFTNLFNVAQNQFFGALGRQIRGNETPDQTFDSFLDSFPFLSRLQQARDVHRRQVAPGLTGSQTRFHFQPSLL